MDARGEELLRHLTSLGVPETLGDSGSSITLAIAGDLPLWTGLVAGGAWTTNVLAAQTLALAPILLAAAFLHLPRQLYVSPLQAVGGPGPEFFAVELYGIEPETGVARWRFFAPWAPAAGLLSLPD